MILLFALYKNWGYELAREEFGATEIDGGPWCRLKNPGTGQEIIIKDVIADAFLQQILLRPADYSVIATLNLNGDYISDALAAQVGETAVSGADPLEWNRFLIHRPPWLSNNHRRSTW